MKGRREEKSYHETQYRWIMWGFGAATALLWAATIYSTYTEIVANPQIKDGIEHLYLAFR